MRKSTKLIFAAIGFVAGAVVGSRLGYKLLSKEIMKNSQKVPTPAELCKEKNLPKEYEDILTAAYMTGYPEKTVKAISDFAKNKISEIKDNLETKCSYQGECHNCHADAKIDNDILDKEVKANIFDGDKE